MPIRDEGERRFELPEDITPEEERAILMALERYFVAESPPTRAVGAAGPHRRHRARGVAGSPLRPRALARTAGAVRAQGCADGARSQRRPLV